MIYIVKRPCPPSLQSDSGTFNVFQVPNGASRLNYDGSLSNFQDIFLIIYQHDLWWKDDPDPPSLQSGTLIVPNEARKLNLVRSSSNFQDIFLIIYQHNIWCQRWPLPPSLRSGIMNILQAPWNQKLNLSQSLVELSLSISKQTFYGIIFLEIPT